MGLEEPFSIKHLDRQSREKDFVDYLMRPTT